MNERREVEVVIGGGSFAGFETMLALRGLAAERVEVELLAPTQSSCIGRLAVASPFAVSRVLRLSCVGSNKSGGADAADSRSGRY